MCYFGNLGQYSYDTKNFSNFCLEIEYYWKYLLQQLKIAHCKKFLKFSVNHNSARTTEKEVNQTSESLMKVKFILFRCCCRCCFYSFSSSSLLNHKRKSCDGGGTNSGYDVDVGNHHGCGISPRTQAIECIDQTTSHTASQIGSQSVQYDVLL